MNLIYIFQFKIINDFTFRFQDEDLPYPPYLFIQALTCGVFAAIEASSDR